MSTPENINQLLGLPSQKTLVESTEKSILNNSPVTIVIGGGIGGVPAIESAKSQGHKVLVFEAESSPGGKLRNVAAEKHHLKTGVSMLLKSTSDGKVFSFYNAPVALKPGDSGLSLAELIDKFDPSNVYISTGTRERHAIIPQENRDYDEYSNHSYAYELSRQINDHIGNGERLGTLELDFNESGDTVVIIGAGLVGLEDLPAGILAWQIDRLLLKENIEIPESFDYLKFTAKPIKYLKELFNTLTAQKNENSEKMLKLFGEGFGTENDATVVADKLHKLGINQTLVAYRGTKEDILNKPLTTIKSGTLVALPRINVYGLSLQTTIKSIKANRNTIISVELSTENGPKSVKPAYIIHAIGGTAPEVIVGGTKLNTKIPLIHEGVLFSHMGNVIAQLGNMEAAIAQSNLRLEEIARLNHASHEVSAMAFIDALSWMSQQGLIPANPAMAVAESYPTYRLKEWGWT